MSATAQNYTLDDFLQDDSVCTSCGVDDDPDWTVPQDSALGRVMDLDGDGEVCDDCFQDHSDLYNVGKNGR
jgi:hypothetical protein